MSVNNIDMVYMSLRKIAKKYDFSQDFFRKLIRDNKIKQGIHYEKILDYTYRFHIENMHSFLAGKKEEKESVNFDINRYLLE